jgi:outer membrane protein assembly factor BamD (BamD/ComL family)
LAVAAAALLGVVLTISGCSSAQSDWTKAANENTVLAYQNFLAAHPKDEHTTEAQAKILQLQDDNGWIEAQHAGTTAAYQTYLQKFPQGSHAAAAHDAMISIDRAAAWKTAQSDGTAEAFEAFFQKYPTGSEADQAKTIKDLTGYRVRLASESSDDKAKRKLTELKARFGDQLHDLVVTPDASRKSFYIDSGGMAEQGATRACQSIKRKHRACHVIQL